MPDRFSTLPESLKIEIYTFDTTFRIIMKGVLRELIDRFRKPRYPSFFLI